MGTINFTKMNGAGNDFILIDTNNNKDTDLTPELIQKLCDRRKGIGADGVLILKNSSKSDFELEYFNSDGSLGSICGNGARCSLKYASSRLTLKKNEISFICNNQSFSGKINENDLVTFNLNEPIDLKLNLEVKFNNIDLVCHYINTGSPHVIFFWEDIQGSSKMSFNDFDMINFGKKIRYAKEFYPEGTNVNLINIEQENLSIRTYERGVEDETLACGTGTVAAGIIVNLVKNKIPPIIFKTFGNDKLIVQFTKNMGKFIKITLTGPAKINYIGSYNL